MDITRLNALDRLNDLAMEDRLPGADLFEKPDQRLHPGRVRVEDDIELHATSITTDRLYFNPWQDAIATTDTIPLSPEQLW